MKAATAILIDAIRKWRDAHPGAHYEETAARLASLAACLPPVDLDEIDEGSWNSMTSRAPSSTRGITYLFADNSISHQRRRPVMSAVDALAPLAPLGPLEAVDPVVALESAIAWRYTE